MNREKLVHYVLRYGGACRDCADEDGLCPHSGVPCDADIQRVIIMKTLDALEYGITHGFIENPFNGPKH